MEKIYRVQLNSKGMPNFATAVEIADRPQGGWEDTGKDPSHSHPLTAIWYRCSECGYGTNTKTNYCPECGARMLAKDTNVPNKKGADDE